MPLSARDVAAAIRQHQPGVPAVELQKLLYYCQGHHLATTGTPLFTDTISAYDMGPVVGSLWRAEKEGIDDGLRDGAIDLDLDLAEDQLNTVGYVMQRYGGLVGDDLVRLTHHESPWRDADAERPPHGRVTISIDAIREFFVAACQAEADEFPVDETQVLDALLSGVGERSERPAEPDSIVELERRRDALRHR